MLWKLIGNVKSFLDKCKRDNINAFAAQAAIAARRNGRGETFGRRKVNFLRIAGELHRKGNRKKSADFCAFFAEMNRRTGNLAGTEKRKGSAFDLFSAKVVGGEGPLGQKTTRTGKGRVVFEISFRHCSGNRRRPDCVPWGKETFR